MKRKIFLIEHDIVLLNLMFLWVLMLQFSIVQSTGGQCVYQGNGSHIVPFMQSVGLSCPVTHNPADFSEFTRVFSFIIHDIESLLSVIDVSCGEYGIEHLDRMVSASENGKCSRWTPFMAIQSVLDDYEGKVKIEEFEEEIDPKQLQCPSSSWDQFKILYNRRWKQMWRDSVRFIIFKQSFDATDCTLH